MHYNYFEYIQKKFLNNSTQKNYKQNIIIGNTLRVSYKIFENTKEKIQSFEGLIISKKNHNFSKSFTLRKIIQNIGIEQTFFYYSPKIISIELKQKIKIRKAKLYYLRLYKKIN